MTALVDRDQIAKFVGVLFKYADEGTYVSLRSFSQFDRDKPPACIMPVRINGSLEPVVKSATAQAEDAARAVAPIVFAPPIATFTNPQRAGAADQHGWQRRKTSPPSPPLEAEAAPIDEGQPAPDRAALAQLPRGFYVDSRGVWFQPQRAKKRRNGAEETEAKNPPPRWLCAPFDVLGEARDDDSGSWSLHLHWKDRDGESHTWLMPRRLIHSRDNALFQELQDAGLPCSTGKEETALLRSFLNQVSSPGRVRCVARTGWHETDAGLAYVLTNGTVYGTGSEQLLVKSEKAAPLAGRAAQRPQGSLAEWQEHIATPAIGNDLLVLEISTALAGPLLYLVNDPGGGIHKHGRAQSGKTTLVKAGASVWGRGDQTGEVRSWRTTTNGLEATAALVCDRYLPLDEIGEADPKAVGEAAYLLANGSGKSRARRDGLAAPRQTWRLLFSSTGEVPLAARMSERQIRATAGQEIRLVSIPADTGAGMGVFQNLHGAKSAAEFADQMRLAAVTYYGTAGPAFVQALTDALRRNRDAVLRFIAERRRTFNLANVPNGADGQVISVAKRFALIGAAGELAATLGILPWKKDEATRAANAAFRSWLRQRGGHGPAEDTAIMDQLRLFFETHGEARFSALDEQAKSESQSHGGNGYDCYRSSASAPSDPPTRVTTNRAGFRREAGGHTEFLVYPTYFRDEVCKGLDPDRALELLKAGGFLVPGDGKHLQKKVRIAGGGERHRFYVIKGSILE